MRDKIDQIETYYAARIVERDKRIAELLSEQDRLISALEGLLETVTDGDRSYPEPYVRDIDRCMDLLKKIKPPQAKE